MADVTISVIVNKDRRLIIVVPDDVPLGPADLVIKHKEVPTIQENSDRERIRTKLLAAGFLVTDHGISEEIEPISEGELEQLGKMTSGSRPSEELIDEDRGPY
jgi:hypothetical protein